MGLCVISDALTAVGSTQGFGHGISKYFLNCGGAPQISAVNFPTDAVVAPVRSNRVKTLPRRNIKKRRRTKRKTVSGDDGFHDCYGYGYEEVSEFFVGGGDARGPFDNNLGGGSGKGGNFRGFGGSDWGDFSSDNSFYDPAFDFVYEVLSWIVLTNCLHFSYKKLLRIRAARYADTAR